MSPRRLVGLVLALLLVPLLSAAVTQPVAAAPTASAQASAPVKRPSFIVIVVDDMSLDLVRTLGQMKRLEREGASFSNSFTVNSLCCPSRAAFLTGRPPHLSGVETNTSAGPGGPLGGYAAFVKHDGPKRSYNVRLRKAGYRTGFVGKYMNGYEPHLTRGKRVPRKPPRG